MSSILHKIISPCLPSPLANSTKIANNANGDGLNRKSSARQSISNTSTATSAHIPVTPKNSINISISCANKTITNNKTGSGKTSARSLDNRIPLIGRKLTVKKNTEPIKTIAYNCKNNNVTVEKILKQINMSKYQQCFKKIDVAKFKELRELDLNAIGITRPADIKILMEAIKKAKSDL